MKPDVLLIDGRNYLFRHGFTRHGLSSNGRPTGALYGAISGLERLHRLFPEAALVFCWDGKDSGKSWRHVLCPEYKSNRKTKNIPKSPHNDKMQMMKRDVVAQIPLFEKWLDNFGLRQFSVRGLEADDLIGIMATALAPRVHKLLIYSTDKDFYQLIRRNIAVVRDLDKKKNGLEITAKEIRKQFGVRPQDWLKYRAFVGDPGDKIDKPIRGIGDKTALKIVAAGVDASQPTPHPDYKEHWENIRLAYKLSKIIRRPTSKWLNYEAQKQLKQLVKLEPSSLFRSQKRMRNKRRYERMCNFLAEYELEQLFSHRHEIWSIR